MSTMAAVGRMAGYLADPLYLLILPYIALQPVFRKFVQKTDIYEKNKHACKLVMAYYNVVMAVFSLVSFVGMTACCVAIALKGEGDRGLFGLGHYDQSTLEGRVYFELSKYFYLSKYIEFVDTYFLILCGREVGWLQFIHHIGAPIDMGVWHNNEIEGTWIFVAFNGLIHTIMYYYYACCIMKWKFPLPKSIITSCQLTQFVVGLTLVWSYYFTACWWEGEVRRFGFWVNYAYVGIVLTLFINFYIKTYITGPKKKKAAARRPRSSPRRRRCWPRWLLLMVKWR
jgi:hypothetical protein